MSNVTFTITATMSEDWADHFCSFLKRMEHDGKIGQSEAMGFYIDGDGVFGLPSRLIIHSIRSNLVLANISSTHPFIRMF